MSNSKFWDYYRNEDGVVTVDAFIERGLPPTEARASLLHARWFFFLARMPAALRGAFRAQIEQYKLFVRYGHVYHRVTGASRMGEVYLTTNLDLDTGYEKRVHLDDPRLDYTTFISFDQRCKPPVIFADEGYEEKFNSAEHLEFYPYDVAATVLAQRAAEVLENPNLELHGWTATTQHMVVGLRSK